MIGQKLAKILQSLDSSEFRRLKKAVGSPYFATNPRLLMLYGFLKKQYPSFDEKKLQKEKLFAKLYPGQPYNDGLLRVLIREFTGVVEEFLLMERLRASKRQRKKMLVKEYGERNLYEYFKKGTEGLLEDGESDFVKDMEYYGERIELYQDYCFHPMTNNHDVKDNSLELLMESLDGYFILAKYRFAQILKNRDTVLNRTSNIKFLKYLTEDVYDFSFKCTLTKAYKLMNKMHDTEKEEYFYEFKKLLFQNIDKIKRTDCRILYYIGLNYCSRKVNIGEIKKFSKESLAWYKMGLEKKLLIENGKMSDVTFVNICAAAGREKEVDWGFEFIKEYEKFIDKTYKADAVNYGKSILFFNKGEYGNSLKILNSHNFLNKNHLHVRMLILVNVFEQALIDYNFFTVLKSGIKANKKYLRRSTVLSDKRKQSLKVFINTLDKLSGKYMNGKKKKEIREWILKVVEKENNLPFKKWFIEKTENMNGQ